MSPIRPGPRNLITDVDGIAVGNAEDWNARTGVTIVLPDRAATAAVDVRGGAPGTRDTDALDLTSLVDRIDAVALSGGSVHGLDAARGATLWLAERGRGFAIGPARVPVVPAAILFDLLNGGDKDWGVDPPYGALARMACDTAGAEFALGNAGAGLGAKAAGLKGGLGSASAVTADGLQIGALIAANPLGSVTMPGQGTLWAWALEQNSELGGQHPPTIAPADPSAGLDLPPHLASSARPGANTTIGVVATNADLTRAEARRIAIMAQDGFARAIRPSHTPFDGDTLFVLATGTVPLPEPRARALYVLGGIAADCVARAVARGVFLAETLGDRPGYRTRHADAFGPMA
jgi:L-aminopeptidase/D-esterase-like protein